MTTIIGVNHKNREGMKAMKRFFYGILVLMTVLCFATACGTAENSSSSFDGGSTSQSSETSSGNSSTDGGGKSDDESYVYPGPY